MVESRKAIRIKKIENQHITRDKNRPRKAKERVRKVAAAEAKAQRLQAKGVK